MRMTQGQSTKPHNTHKMNAQEIMNEVKQIEIAIEHFEKLIELQGRITNARDEDHLTNLKRVKREYLNMI